MSSAQTADGGLLRIVMVATIMATRLAAIRITAIIHDTMHSLRLLSQLTLIPTIRHTSHPAA
ncbi:MAG TPA: hypothetical protein VGG18_03910 [Granulicella sp.]